MPVTGDPWNNVYPPMIDGPYIDGVVVTPSDTVDLPFVARALLATVGGTVTYITTGNTTLQVTLLSGVLYPFRAKRVMATGTAATGITAHV